MEQEIENIFYNDVNANQESESIDKKGTFFNSFEICDEIKNLEDTIEDLERLRKSYARLMFTMPTISLAMGFTLSIGVAIFSTLENLTIQNFIEVTKKSIFILCSTFNIRSLL